MAQTFQRTRERSLHSFLLFFFFFLIQIKVTFGTKRRMTTRLGRNSLHFSLQQCSILRDKIEEEEAILQFRIRVASTNSFRPTLYNPFSSMRSHEVHGMAPRPGLGVRLILKLPVQTRLETKPLFRKVP
jgi:hypothetical protein